MTISLYHQVRNWAASRLQRLGFSADFLEFPKPTLSDGHPFPSTKVSPSKHDCEFLMYKPSLPGRDSGDEGSDDDPSFLTPPCRHQQKEDDNRNVNDTSSTPPPENGSTLQQKVNDYREKKTVPLMFEQQITRSVATTKNASHPVEATTAIDIIRPSSESPSATMNTSEPSSDQHGPQNHGNLSTSTKQDSEDMGHGKRTDNLDAHQPHRDQIAVSQYGAIMSKRSNRRSLDLLEQP